MAKTRVLIVDDSELIRTLFTEILSSDPGLEVIGTANSPLQARQMIKDLNPDVLTLDIEMPGMDGISFLEKIMTLRPMPVVMVSSLTQKGTDATFRCLELGAVDYIPKETSNAFNLNFSQELIQRVKAAAMARVKPLPKWGLFGAAAPSRITNASGLEIIAIGASTGGVEAIRAVITEFPDNLPPVVITQHMPKGYTATFARRMNELCAMTVSEVKDRDPLLPGHAYIAQGGLQFAVARQGSKLVARVSDDPPVSGHKPSVDHLFQSVAAVVGGKSLGVILTGMGKDGAMGLLEMRKLGAITIGQDEDTCVVYGMPRMAYLAGGVQIQLPLEKIAQSVVKSCEGGMSTRKASGIA